MSQDQNACHRRLKFFRVLLPGFTSKLPVPQEFTKYFMEEQSSWATILSPLGKAWHVKIHGDSRMLYFAEGWERFAETHKLSVGDFLVLKYKGSLVFDVTIFDRSTFERDYSFMNGVVKDRAPREEENSGRGFMCTKKQQRAPSCSKRADAVMDEGTSKNPGGTKEKGSQRQDCKTPEVAKGCKRGASFEVEIKPFHKYQVAIPTSFGEPNHVFNIHQLLLRDPKGCPWPARLVHGLSRRSTFISRGWRDFRVGNSIEDGDVCIFELIKEKNEMHVQVRRRGGLNPTKISEDGSRGTKRFKREKTTIEVAKRGVLLQQASQSVDASVRNPQFTATMVPTSIKKHLHIPMSFLSSVDLSGVHEALLVDQKSRQWPAKLYHLREGQKGRIKMAWRTFRDANNVELGDVCVFRFRPRAKKATFLVEVIKSTAGHSRCSLPLVLRHRAS